MAFLSRTPMVQILLTYKNESIYLHIDPHGCALFGADSKEAFYQIQEPLLLAQATMTDSKTIHLVVLKSSGELCYTLISGAGTPQTTVLAKLDVRSTRYRKLFLFPQGKVIHIFYAYAHQSIPNLWHIEHRFWDGSTWLSTHMGEVVSPREPLYHVNLDNQGNLHLMSITFLGRHSLLFTNRFNGTFHIWGSPTETLKISGEAIDMAALMTSDNVHHLFWVAKIASGQFELRSIQQREAHELGSTWQSSLAPIKTFNAPWKNIGAIEMNGVLWLLACAGEETLLRDDDKGWKLVSSHPLSQRPLQWVHNGEKISNNTCWLEDQTQRQIPAYYLELGLNFRQQVSPLQSSYSPIPSQTTPYTPPPIPAFYPDPLSLNSNPTPPISTLKNANLEPLELPLDSPEAIDHQPLIEDTELGQLITTVTHLEQENTNFGLVLQTLLSKFDQILGAISENGTLPKQPLPETDADPGREQAQSKIYHEELGPFKETMSNLEKETQGLSQVLRVMLTKQEENDSALQKLETRLCQLQTEKEDIQDKGGFWNKWFS